LVAVLVVLAVWQGAVWLHVKPSFVLPSPQEVGASLASQARSGELFDGVWRSLSRGLFGFAASVVIGTPLGLAVARIGPLRTAIKPILSGLQSLPSVAWVPAAVIWFSLSNTAIYFVVLMGAVPSIANGMVSGLDQVPPLHEKVGTVLGARGLRAARYVLLPAALPGYLGGLRQGWAFAWRSLMAAELITQSPQLGTGLGQQLDQARTLSDISLVFGLVLVILVVGVAIELVVFAPLERRVLRRRGLLLG
jgi:NitT/TauT family transport system permease protein